MLWASAKASNLRQIIKNQIRAQKTKRKTKKKAYEDKIEAIKEQAKQKRIVWRQHKRRIAQDPGQTPGKERQTSEFRLYNKLKIAAEREIKALEREIDATKKEKDAELAAIQAEIDSLEADYRLCR